MDRATKLIVFGGTVAALVAQTMLSARGWSALLPMVIGLFAAAAIAAAVSRRAVALVVVCTYVFPALIDIGHGVYNVEYDVLWMAALFGAMLPDAVRTPWRIPRAWRPALVCWALIIIVGLPIVVWREVDFNALIHGPMPYADLGAGATLGVSWILHVGLVLLAGILWFDWLFSIPETEFYPLVVAPLTISAFVMIAVAAYQLFSDVMFLNGTSFGVQKRTAGTLYDANVSGAVAAMWVGGMVLATDRLRRLRWPVLGLGLVLAWLAVWGSGSRTAFIAALIVSAFNMVALSRALGSAPNRVVIGRVGLAAGATLALLVVLGYANLLPDTPVSRILPTLPTHRGVSIQSFVRELWNRNGYGLAASEMIRKFPLVGIGLGSFHALVFGFLPGRILPPDNAQNWYRHQLAEFGLLGSLGWIVWVVGFGWFLLRRRAISPGAWTVRGMVVALAVISLVGMPTQHLVAALTFWTAAFWYASLVGVPAPAPLGGRAWLLIVAVPVAYAIGTAEVAATRLSVPGRIEYVGPAHTYGLYWPEADGAGGQFRWAGKEAAAVVDAPLPWMVLTVGVNHLDIASKPVDAYVWCDGALVINTRLQSIAPVTVYVPIRSTRRVLIESWVSRVVVPRELGIPDDRQFGLMVNWRFVQDPPPGAVNIVRR